MGTSPSTWLWTAAPADQHPNQAQPLGDGAPDALTLEAARHGGGLAVVAVIRPELVALDLDGCSGLVRPDLMHAAGLVGAALV